MAQPVELNQGVPKPIKGPGNPSFDYLDPEIKMIKGWMAAAKKSRSEFDKNWPDYMRAYKGQTWKGKDPGQPFNSGEGKRKPEINITRAVIQSIIPILTDTQPGFNPIPRRASDFEFAEMLGEATESVWERQNMAIKIVEILMDQSIFDYAIAKVTWDGELEDGLGDVSIEVVDPNDLWVNPEAIDFNRKWKYSIERFYKTVGEWKMLFPKAADKIRPDASNRKRTEDTAPQNASTAMTFISPVDQDRNKDADAGPGVNEDNEVAEGWQVWYIDNAVEEYIENEGEENEKRGLRKKYPNGHLTTILPNQNLKLQSIPNPYEGIHKNPYIRFVDMILPRQFHGEGEVEPLMHIQLTLNKTVQMVLEYMRLMANPVWIMDKTSGVNKNKLTNKVGLIIQKEPNTDVRRDFPQSIPPYVFEFINLLMKISDIISGVQDVTQGRKPAGIQAAQAVETLQEAAQTRIRLKERNQNASLGQMATMIINRILQFYRGTRYQQIAGDDSFKPQYVEFNIEPIQMVEGAPSAEDVRITKRVSLWNPETQKYEEQPLTEATGAVGNYNVKVRAGTAMPFQKTQRISTAFRLYDSGALTKRGLLEAVDWPNFEQELERLEEEARAAAEAQAQAAPAPV